MDYMLIRFRFSEKWRYWKSACIFVGNLVVLVMGVKFKRLTYIEV